MGKKAKKSSETPPNREREIEAGYYARKLGLTKEETLQILKDADTLKPLASARDHSKRR